MTPRDWIALAQVAASLLLAGVALITLKRASATLLQPLRTEVFKVQLEELRDLLKLLARKGELDLREQMGFGELVEANAVRIHDLFFRDVYGVTINEHERPYSTEHCSLSVVHEDFLLPRTEGAGPFFRGQQLAVLTPRTGPSEDARSLWLNFRLDELRVPNKLSDSIDRLRGDMSSPLLPVLISQRLDELLKAINGNLSVLSEVLSSAGRTLPGKFNEPSPPKTMTVGWVKDLYFSRLIALHPRAEAVVQAIREYLATDRLWKPW
jgi:hypothetical protein